MKKILFLLFILQSFVLKAQEIEMADTMRSNGKIYVVLAIVIILFVGLLVYLISIDKKLKSIENEVNEKLK